jgi:branched-chain amino acid transport system ATP-binding protein
MPILELQKVTKHFGKLAAVSDVSLILEKGEILGLIGPNGSGKTTLINMVSGFLPIDSGRIIYKGKDITGIRPYKASMNGIGRTFQIPKGFRSLTVHENLKVGYIVKANKSGSDVNIDHKVREIMDAVGITAHANDEINMLPQGDLKRLDLARALSTEPELLLLDEPFSGLTHAEVSMLRDLLADSRRRGMSLILVEHQLREVLGLVDRLIVLNFGQKISEGLVEEVMNAQQVIDAYLGADYVESR